MSEHEREPQSYLFDLEESVNFVGIVSELPGDKVFQDRMAKYSESIMRNHPSFAHIFEGEEPVNPPSIPLVAVIESTLLERFQEQDNMLDYFDVGLEWITGDRGSEACAVYDEAWNRFIEGMQLKPRSKWNIT